MEEDRKYRKYDEYLKNISKHITPTQQQFNEYENSFKEVFLKFRALLRETDPLLRTFEKIIYVGSNANNIKIGLPDEFDMNLCIKLPAEIYNTIEILNCPQKGYIQLKVKDLDKLKKHQNWENYKSIDSWLDKNGFILQTNFRTWMESIVTKTLNKLSKTSDGYIILSDTGKYLIKFKKSGPAFTMNVLKQSNGIRLDIDIVPALYFELPLWPPNIKQKYTSLYKKSEWYAIAKPFQGETTTYWRPSFSQQENEILSGHNNLKSTIRFMKALRDANGMPYIASYFINTLFMLETDQVNQSFWSKPLSYLFMYMIQKFKKRIDEGEIPYYWIRNQNLLDRISTNQQKDCAIKLKNLLTILDNSYEKNPIKIEIVICGKYILNNQEPISENSEKKAVSGNRKPISENSEKKAVSGNRKPISENSENKPESSCIIS